MATHNTGTTATLGQSAHTVPFTFTIPGGVLAGDVMIVGINTFSFPLTGPATSTPTSGGGSWTAVGPLVAAQNGTAGVFATAWQRVATAGDPGSTFTISWTGGVGGTDGFWWTATFDAYTGFWTADPIAQSITPTSGAQTAVGTCPSGTSLRSGSWVVQLAPITPNSSGTITGVPPGMTQRQLSNGNSGVSNASADSNASVGAAGTAIGGGSFTSSNATDNWWTEWTIELATVAGGAPATVSAPVGPPLIPPHPHFTSMLLGQAWQRADWQAQGVADLTVGFASTSGGVDTYNVTSPWNGGTTQQMRVLAPTTANANYPRAFLLMLPVDPNQDTTFGDSIGVAQGLGAHNQYNLTCVQPGYAAAAGTGPWFGDNPLDTSISQEKYTLLVTAWIRANLAVTGAERVFLIGFSRSGLGGQGLLFRHPDLFAACASWDAPFMMTDYDGTDPTNGGSIGGSPASVYGTSSNFTTKYQLSAAHLSAWQATGQHGVNRIWLGLGPGFPADTPAYDAALTAAGIPHSYAFANTVESHAWHSDWVASALAAIIPSNWSQGTTVLPQQLPSPLLADLLDLASVRLDPGADAAAVTLGTASLAGTASLSALAVTLAPASLSGAGAVAGLSVQAAGLGIAGAGSLAALATESAVASLAGAGSVSASAGGGQTASLSGAGSVSAAAVVIAPCSPAGAAALSAAVTVAAAAQLPGAGSVAALAVTRAPAALSGAGAVSASGAERGPFTTGILTASDAPSGSLTTATQATGGPS